MDILAIQKIDDSCIAGITAPDNWQVVVDFSEAPRSTYAEIREAVPDREIAKKALLDFIRNSRLENCTIDWEYLKAIQLVDGVVNK